eukprot:3131121-Pleurochrysis_carterae.AAC.1
MACWPGAVPGCSPAAARLPCARAPRSKPVTSARYQRQYEISKLIFVPYDSEGLDATGREGRLALEQVTAAAKVMTV